MTTRKFSRTMNEAFPQTADYGCAVTRSRNDDKTIFWGCGVIAVVLVLMVIAGWLE